MNPRVSRRTLVKTLTLASLGGAIPAARLLGALPPAQERPAVADYLDTLARPDGGYAWPDQQQSHLTPTFAVIASFRVLGLEPPRRDLLVRFVREHHPARLKKLEQEHRQFEYQQIQALLWLGADASSFIPQVESFRRR